MKKITLKNIAELIEDLAISTQNSFAAMTERFDGVDKRFDMVEIKIDKIDNRLKIVEGARYHAHETRLENIEDTLRTMRTKLKMK